MIPNKIAESIPTHVIRALGAGLQIYPENRAQSAARLRELLNAAPSVVAQAAQAAQPPQPEPKPQPAPQPDVRHSAPPTEKPKGGKNKAVIIILVVLIVAAVAAGIYVVKFSGLVDGRGVVLSGYRHA